MDELQTLIYALIDPRSHLICYVGQSTQGMKRPKEQNRRGPVKTWMVELAALQQKYEIIVLERVQHPYAYSDRCHWWKGTNATGLNDAERWWIAYGRALGWPLLNQTEGGEGTRGYVPTNDTRQKMSVAQKRYRAVNPTILRGIERPDVRARFTGENSSSKRFDVREKLRAANGARLQNVETREANRVQLRTLWKVARSKLIAALNNPALIEWRRNALFNKTHPIHSAKARAKRSGTKHPKARNDISNEAIYTLRAMGNGFTHKFIADAIGVSKAYVQKQLDPRRLERKQP